MFYCTRQPHYSSQLQYDAAYRASVQNMANKRHQIQIQLLQYFIGVGPPMQNMANKRHQIQIQLLYWCRASNAEHG